MASLSSSARAWRGARRLLPALLAFAFLGMAGKPVITVRFFLETTERDTEKFAKPLTFRHPQREAFIERLPAIHEKQIRAVYPFQAADGSWGCAFQLDRSGRLALEVLSTQRRGRSLVPFVGTKLGAHQLDELLIDKSILDGIISIPAGLTELEVAALTKGWPVLGQKKRKRAPKVEE